MERNQKELDATFMGVKMIKMWKIILKRADYMGRTSDSGEQVHIVATPHFLHGWNLERYGKSKSKSLTALLGSWRGVKTGFYEALLDAPLNQTMYAIIRKRKGLKAFAFLYFRNIVNDTRDGRRELELITVTPPTVGQSQGINFKTYHDHRHTELWADLEYK